MNERATVVATTTFAVELRPMSEGIRFDNPVSYRRTRCGLLLAAAAADFALNIVDHFGSARGMEFRLHAAERHSNDVAMMQLRTGTRGTQFQPEAVSQLDVLGPEPRRMRAEVKKHDVLLVSEYDLERKSGPGFGKFFPVV